jgi:hypothetical protein
MQTNQHRMIRGALVITLISVLTFASTRLRADGGGVCDGIVVTVPFADVDGNPFYCQIAEAYSSGLTNGTTETFYSPHDPVPREQMAAFVTRTMDQSLSRGSRRAALNQFWTPTSLDGLGLTTIGSGPEWVESDGVDLWVTNFNDGTVSRVRASDGTVLGTWTGALGAYHLVVAKGLVFISGFGPGNLFQIDPAQPAGAVTTVTNAIGSGPIGIAFDGSRIWTASQSGFISIVTLNPVTVTMVSTGFAQPFNIMYDGANMWVTDQGGSSARLLKLDSNGAIVQTVNVGLIPRSPAFDGTNIWVPNRASDSITVVRASTGAVVATLTGNGLNGPQTAAFDGERILVANFLGDSVSLWKATDLTPLGFVSTGSSTSPSGACSDGLNFWVVLNGTGKLARF